MANDAIEVTNQEVTNPMFIDTDNFNFFDLEDVVQEDTNELGYSTKQTGKDLMTEDEIADLTGGDEVEEDETEDEVDEGVEDEEDESEETEEGEVEVTDEDGEEVDFESYEVTLPSGEVVVLSEAIQGYKAASELKAEREEFETTRNAFAQESEKVAKYLELARLEADRVIEDYEDFDWASYKKDDPVGYVENREFLDRYKARRQEILKAQEELEAEKAEKEAEDFKVKAREAGVILARDIPGWNNDMYQQLMVYAVENGANAEDIANSVDPVMFKILHKAMQHDKGKQVVKAKVKRVGGSPKKVATPSAKPAPTSEATQKGAAKKAIIKKMENGGLNERELRNSFNFLED
ncbi:hypothetical protein [Salmonella phage SE131]|uniref:Capsid and scaffold protein n=1 Tax=Salmonella phage SE131 TaxID=2081631 RepID=A0A2P1CAM0_9CAUD|nr:hypothetical protein PQC35_gp026 [Salmonella phage SE131]AVJ48273.1 hypothetical protein [Salmonella phage SE131]